MDIPVTNKTAMPLTVGGSIIPPGETFILPEHQVPEHLRPAVVAATDEPMPDPVATLLAAAVKDIQPLLSRLSDQELADVKAAEIGGDNRKTLLQIITEEELRRANQAQIRKQLETLDNVTLENYFNDLPDNTPDHEVATQLMRERGLGVPGIMARLEGMDSAQLAAHRETVVDNEQELAIVDELLAALDPEDLPPA